MEAQDFEFVFDADAGVIPELGFDFGLGQTVLGVSSDSLLLSGSVVPPSMGAAMMGCQEDASSTSLSQGMQSNGTSEEEVVLAASAAPKTKKTSKKNGSTSSRTTTARTRRKRSSRGGNRDDDDEDEDDMNDDGDEDGQQTSSPSADTATPHAPVRFNPAERHGKAFNFTKDELAVMTCPELDAYKEQAAAHRTLTPDEEALFKKYRRQIRNRECAQSMRARKRQQMDDLSKTVDELKTELDQQTRRADAAEREASHLKTRIHYLEGLLKDRNIPFQPNATFGSSTRKGLAAAATTTLFVFLFSVGLYLGPSLRGPEMPVASTVVPPPPPMGVATPSDVKVYGAAAYMPSVSPTEGSDGRGGLAGTGRQLLVAEKARVIEKEPVARYVVRDASREEPRKSMRIIEKGASIGTKREADKLGLVESSTVRQHGVPSPFEAKFDRPDTEYMYCPVAHHITSTHKPEEDHEEDQLPSRVSIIVPGDAFNASSMFQNMAGPPPLVEVTCSVVDIWPVWPSHNGQVADK